MKGLDTVEFYDMNVTSVCVRIQYCKIDVILLVKNCLVSEVKSRSAKEAASIQCRGCPEQNRYIALVPEGLSHRSAESR